MGYYLFATIDNWKALLLVIATSSFILSLVTLVSYMSGDLCTCDDKKVKNVLKAGPTIFCITAFLLAVIPNQKQLAFILVAPKIVENQNIQNGLVNSTEILNLGTQYIKDRLQKINEEIANENNK